MKITFLSFLLVGSIVLSCTKARREPRYLKAQVVLTSDISCNLPVLNFSEDSAAIRSFTNRNDINYNVLNLPADFTIQNKKLYVEVTTLKSSEEFPCNTLGISYPRLKISEVKDRQ